MSKKLRASIFIGVFFAITFLDCLFTRIGTKDLMMEANPLVKKILFEHGATAAWIVLVGVNVLMFLFYAVLVWYSFVIYKSPVVKANSFAEYWKNAEKEHSVSSFFAMLGYAMAFSLVLSRLMVVVEWAVYLTGYRIPWYEFVKRKIPLGRPDLWVLIILVVVFCVLWYFKEYRDNKKSAEAL